MKRLPRRSVLAAAASFGALINIGPVAAMPHVVLLGDSVFDNGAYVRGGPDVVSQLRHQLPAGWDATLLAQDGSVISDLFDQLLRVPASASHLIVSAGGNDALRYSSILNTRSRSVAESVDQLAAIQQEFTTSYRALLDGVLALGLPLAVCTIYDPRFAEPDYRRIATTALAVLNDRLIREAVARGLPILDLRLICDDDEDFANPIEPSTRGGQKIATAIATMLREHNFRDPRTRVYADR